MALFTSQVQKEDMTVTGALCEAHFTCVVSTSFLGSSSLSRTLLLRQTCVWPFQLLPSSRSRSMLCSPLLTG